MTINVSITSKEQDNSLAFSVGEIITQALKAHGYMTNFTHPPSTVDGPDHGTNTETSVDVMCLQGIPLEQVREAIWARNIIADCNANRRTAYLAIGGGQSLPLFPTEYDPVGSYTNLAEMYPMRGWGSEQYYTSIEALVVALSTLPAGTNCHTAFSTAISKLSGLDAALIPDTLHFILLDNGVDCVYTLSREEGITVSNFNQWLSDGDELSPDDLDDYDGYSDTAVCYYRRMEIKNNQGKDHG